jgi:hypothetical protein
LKETRKHGVYTAFSIDFDTGEVKYISPSYKFNVNKLNGELEAIGQTYTPEATIDLVVTEWLTEKGSAIEEQSKNLDEKSGMLDAKLFEIDEKMSHDYLVEVGEVKAAGGTANVSWTYRKWASGISECWINFYYEMESINITPQKYGYHFLNAYDNRYEDKDEKGTGMDFPEGLFVSKPFVNYDIGNEAGALTFALLKSSRRTPTKYRTGALYVDAENCYTNTSWEETPITNSEDKNYTFPEDKRIPIHVSIEAKGRWK